MHPEVGALCLYHYTCDDGATGIARDGMLLPFPHPLLPEPLVWLTDLDTPIPDALGLTSLLVTCDRTAHRFTVRTGTAIWWPRYARRVDPAIRRMFDLTPGAMPTHWWVSTTALRLEYQEAGEVHA